MSVLESVDLPDSATARLASQNDQQAGTSVLPPFSGNLFVDEKLKLSNANFKQTIDDFFKHKDISSLSQIRSTPPFPTPYVLAQFSSKAYRNYKTAGQATQRERGSHKKFMARRLVPHGRHRIPRRAGVFLVRWPQRRHHKIVGLPHRAV
jgi:hypothetical protein